MRRGVPFLGAGGVLLVLEGAEHFFGIIESLDFVKTKLPDVYRVVTSSSTNTAVSLSAVILLLIGLRRVNGEVPGPVRGSKNSVQNVDRSPGTQVAAGNIINQYGPQTLVSAGRQVRPEKAKPKVVQRGVVAKLGEFPYWDRSSRDWVRETLTCQALAIRNDADSSEGDAYRLVAHLDFDSDQGSHSINEGWWIEDGDRGAQNQLDIGRSQTKHLLIAARSEAGACLAVGKVWHGEVHRYLPDGIEQLQAGKWRLVVEIRGDNIRSRYYLSGIVEESGGSRCSRPSTVRPNDWPPEVEE